MSTFLALASISRQISLNTMSLLPIFASSIRSLHAMYRISFMCCFRSPFRFVLFGVFMMMFLRANSLRRWNLD